MIPVNQGSRGPEVMFLQRMLNKRARQHLVEDGAFGPRTHAALVAFQSANRVAPPHGIAGGSTGCTTRICSRSRRA